MKKYSYEDIRKIISDMRESMDMNKDSDKLCASAEEFIGYLIDSKKYIIPEKREEWCNLIHGIMYDIAPAKIPMLNNKNITPQIARGIENHDNMLTNEILIYVHVAEIMESYEEKGLDGAIDVFNSKELTDWARADVIYDVLRFSMFGPEFVELVAPERLKKLKFKRTYDEITEYLDKRYNLENRLAYALKVKATLEEYKNHCLGYYFWECDNTEEKKAYRKERLEKLGDEYLLTIVNNSMIFAKYVLQKMKDENKDYEDKVFTSVYILENDYLSLGWTGGHFADELYQVECYGNTIWISGHILKSILKGLSLENDYDAEERIDGDIGCTYTYPKINLKIETDKFNEYYQEFFENQKRNISL